MTFFHYPFELKLKFVLFEIGVKKLQFQLFSIIYHEKILSLKSDIFFSTKAISSRPDVYYCTIFMKYKTKCLEIGSQLRIVVKCRSPELTI